MYDERYNRQVILKGFGEEAQKKLSQARVLVVGAGGLGCPCLQYLVAAGVGTIGIVEDDVVALSNLHRQILYKTEEIGLPKIDRAVAALKNLNPTVSITAHAFRLENRNALATMRAYDYVIDGTDNFSSRYMINDACVLLGKPLIYGAVAQFQGQVAIFNVPDKNGAVVSYRDLFPNQPKDNEIPNCAEGGVLGVLPGIIGTMQAAELIKLVAGIGKPLINRLLTYDVLTNEMYEVSIEPSVATASMPKTEEAFLNMDYGFACAIKNRGVVEIDGDELRQLIKDPNAMIVDVREIGEQPSLEDLIDLQIPMSVFPQRIGKMVAPKVVLVCQHGVRSLYAGEMLQEVFGTTKELYSLKGGVVRWMEMLSCEFGV